MKKVRKEQLLGQRGANLVERIVLEMEFVWRPNVIFDTGVDGEIEFRNPETGEVSGSIVKVQVKAGQSYFKEETGSTFTFIAEGNDLEYWLKGNVPVILIVCKPDTGEAYWLALREFFKKHPELLKQRRIPFNKKTMAFNKSAMHDLLNQTLPVELGLYFPAERRSEVLQTNLLRVVDYPQVIYTSRTEYRTREDVWAFLKSRKAQVTGEWFLKDKQIYSFLDLTTEPLSAVCELGTIEQLETNDWAFSDDPDMRNNFVRLAGLAFRELCWKRRFRFNKKYKCMFYAPTKSQVLNNKPFRVRYKSFQRMSTCMFFNSYGSKKDAEIIFYYRHVAFTYSFRLLNDSWYIAINPTYIFTYDGRNLSRRIDEYLSNIKREEHNSNVVRYVRAIGQYLQRTRKGDFFEKPDLIKIEPVQEIPVEFGLNDKQWYSTEEEKPFADPEDKKQYDLF
jgi:hypothetical protein